MTEKQAEFCETLALTLESNQRFFVPMENPEILSDVSCGCTLHFAEWLLKGNGKRARMAGWADLQAATGLSEDALWDIYGDPGSTAQSAADRLRVFVDEAS